MASDVKVSDKAVKAAIAEMQRWGINPPYLLAAVQDALQAAFDAQARYDEVVDEVYALGREEVEYELLWAADHD